MTSALIKSSHLRTNPQELRQDLQEGDTPDLRRRRGVIGLSLLGMASMAAVSLLQTGIVKHLPDPPLRGFDKEKAWCGYCIVGALANLGILALTLPEARCAIAVLRGPRGCRQDGGLWR